MNGDPLPGMNSRDLGSHLGDLARELVAGNERLTDEEIAVPSLEVIVQVRAADAARSHADQNASGGDRRRGVLLKA